MPVRNHIRFLLNGEAVSLSAVNADDTLLDYLRLQQRLTGTKEGCAEGDCGACTVLVGRLLDNKLRYETVNACIRFLPSLDGCHIVTIEHLGKDGLHPVQKAMVDEHGSQCGFCTPGFVMSLYGLWMANPSPSEMDIERALQGNLCRCTGYAPIIRASKSVTKVGGQDRDPLRVERDAVTAQLHAWDDGRGVEITETDQTFFIPPDVEQLCSILEGNPDGRIVSGSTDVGLWVTKHMQTIAPAIFIGHLNELHSIEVRGNVLNVGACATYSKLAPYIEEHLPHLSELWWRIGGEQVRNMGTIGGNIANGSPIGDTPPAFIALGAELVLKSASGSRTILLEDFFIKYGKQDLRSDEFVECLIVPIPKTETLNACYKISKRRDEDISALCGAFQINVGDDGIIASARIAMGGMAGTPKRASKVEEKLVGKLWSAETIQEALPSFDEDFTPLSDARASAEYRALTAKNLLRRFHMEHSGDGNVRLDRIVEGAA